MPRITGSSIALDSVFPAQAFPPGRIQRGLTHWWPLDGRSTAFKGDGTTTFITQPRVGSIYGTALTQSNGSGGPPFDTNEDPVMNFNSTGSTRCLLSADPLGGGGKPAALSAALWVNPRDFASGEGATANPRILSFQSDMTLGFLTGAGTASPAGGINVGTAGATTQYSTTTAVAQNVWTHIAFTITGTTTFAFYFNGILQAQQATGDGLSGDASVWAIGCRGTTAGSLRCMNGRIADVMLFNRTTLTRHEIFALYNSYFLPVEELPALYIPPAAGAPTRPGTLPMMGVG